MATFSGNLPQSSILKYLLYSKDANCYDTGRTVP